MQKPQTVEFLERIVLHDRFRRVDQAIAAAHQTSGFRPKSLIVTGLSGTGKSTLINRYRREIPAMSTEECDHMPVLLVEVASRPDLRTFMTEMLQALGHPRPARRATLGQLRLDIMELIKLLRVELIIVDEFHDLLPRENRHSAQIMKLIKAFMNQLQIPWVLVGMPESTDILESGDGQLRRRFSASRHLAPFGMDTEEEFNEFRRYLRSLHQRLPVQCQNLADENTALRMYCASRGFPGLIANILQYLIEAHDGDGKATLTDLGAAYNHALEDDTPVDDGGAGFNPFTAPMERVRREVGA